MLIKLMIFFTTLVVCDCILYSSFWAPLFNPRILNYRVDISFDPNEGRRNREEYKEKYGVTGEKLVAELGNGKAPTRNDQIFNDVKFYYTYPGADNIS